MKFQLIPLLAFCAVQPSTRGYVHMVLVALLDNLKLGNRCGWPILEKAVETIMKLPIPRNEKYDALWSSVDLVLDPTGFTILSALVEIVPPEKRNDLCATLAELVHTPNQQLQLVCIAGMRKNGYRAGIPDLRDVVETCGDSTVVVGAAAALVSFGDSASASSIRVALTQSVNGYYWAELAKHLHAIEGSACAEYVAEQFLNLTEETQLYTLSSTGLFQDFREKPLSDALRILIESSPNADLRREAQSKLTALGAA